MDVGFCQSSLPLEGWYRNKKMEFMPDKPLTLSHETRFCVECRRMIVSLLFSSCLVQVEGGKTTYSGFKNASWFGFRYII